MIINETDGLSIRFVEFLVKVKVQTSPFRGKIS